MREDTTKLSDDPFLAPYQECIRQRKERLELMEKRLCNGLNSISEFACAHEFYGLHKTKNGWVFRELAPNASAMWLVGDFSNWKRKKQFRLSRINDDGVWELQMAESALCHGQNYHLELEWPGGSGQRIPAYARRVVQDPRTNIFSAQVWDPENAYVWKNGSFRTPDRNPLIYEAHVGMAQEEPGIGTYLQFARGILPRIADAGYNTLQLMAVMEHPYYGSFGYQVSSFFACSSRFGTPEELKELIDTAHGMGIAVIMDLVHSHSVRNENDGIANFDGTRHLYFHSDPRGHHPVWDSSCFDYGRIPALHFLLSNCRYWLDEFYFDGFRFDGVTSMLYLHHGLGVDFVNYSQYFDANVDLDAYIYLALANRVIHQVRPDAITIAEDVSGMPGLGTCTESGGAGFDFRLAMGVTETWGKLVRDVRDEDWSMSGLLYELTNRRTDEQTISYVESHDQALVGGKTLLFEMTGPAIYDSMHRTTGNLCVQRAVALHKLARLATIASSGNGYLNFMGNEFGHPEWIDFPREGNEFSYMHARRQWSLRDNRDLFFSALGDFDRAMVSIFSENKHLLDKPPVSLLCDDERKIIVLWRSEHVFMFNFHPENSYEGLSVICPPGAYDIELSTDNEEFGGHGRILCPQTFHTAYELKGSESVPVLRVYMPSRTAIVLRRQRTAQTPKGQRRGSPGNARKHS